MNPRRSITRTVRIASLACAMAVAGASPAHAMYYTQSATNGVTAYANGWVYLSFTNAVNEANVRVSNSSRAGYSLGDVYRAGRSVTMENPHTASTSWVYTSRSAYFGAQNGTEYGRGRACVDVPWSFDTCSAGSAQRV